VTPGGIVETILENGAEKLLTETVQSLALTLQGVDDIESGDSLSAGMLSVGDGISDDVLKESFENCTSFLVHHTGDALDTTTTSETADGWLGDALDVIAHHFAMSLGTTLSKTFASFSSS
jgi:hypothetical protein